MSDQWNYARDGQQHGPVSLEELRELARAGRLDPTDQVWRPGMEFWVAASTIEELWPDAPDASNASDAYTLPQAVPAPLVSYQGPSTDSLLCTQRSLELLSATRLWVRIVSIFLWIIVGLMAVSAIISLFSGRNALGGLVIFVMVLLYGALANYLSRFASHITTLDTDRRPETLERAFEAQRAFWRLAAIALLAIIGFYLVVAIIGMLFITMR